MTNTVVDDQCRVQKGTLHDPYTGEIIQFERGENSNKVQIDHVVALSDAWQKGAQSLSETERKNLANDPLNLLAVDGPANQQKGDGHALQPDLCRRRYPEKSFGRTYHDRRSRPAD
jgi:hypothetical protein